MGLCVSQNIYSYIATVPAVGQYSPWSATLYRIPCLK